MSRHRAPDPGDETTIIPKIVDEPPASVEPAPTAPPRPQPTTAGAPRPQPSPVPPSPALVEPTAARPIPVVEPRQAPPAPPNTGSPATSWAPPSAALVDATPLPVSPARPSPSPLSQPTAPVPPVRVTPLPLPDDATAVIPKVLPTPMAPDQGAAVPVPPQALDPDATAMIPRVPADDSSTMLIGIVPPLPTDTGPSGPRKAKPGDPPVRAVRTKEGDYLSAHSDFTRVTFGSVVRGTLRTTGELMITCGLVILLFAGYEIWGKSAIVDAHQADLDQQLTQQWDQPLPTPTASAGPATTKPLPPPPGNVLGRLYIPRLDKHWVITQGVTPADIRYAPGHYPNSAMPGQQGNFSMAGHRMRSVFWDLDKLQPGDKLIVETRTTWYVYAVVKSRVVKPTQVEVVSAKPPGMTPGRLITLTTCNPKWDNYQRLIIHGSLIGQQSRADGPPEGMEGA
ncbi:LPXTG-site transpeptidase (sortase) family protein [Allocatelliglobosispora scoriae]|uniref:LPXTG-site transpeptidase (Sortase) family protein n=1 Tax=Allocatelliglobosispora scoriae TaxID=643052 RepID=A0A841BWC8_9ACTN|nr:class E sortase [Allocatelliglobosispora scoriae]MBB5871072.1 LPXTG-site transpeptidase (sortase) family protein [Allocatelliglobosispora scoriae]